MRRIKSTGMCTWLIAGLEELAAEIPRRIETAAAVRVSTNSKGGFRELCRGDHEKWPIATGYLIRSSTWI
jgi:hypothetical protein